MEKFVFIAVVAAIAATIYVVLKLWTSLREIVYEYERGILYVNGRCVRVLDPGAYWIFPIGRVLVRMDTRPRLETIKGQEILSRDAVTLRMSVIVEYRVTDPAAAINMVEDYIAAVYAEVQLALREAVSHEDVDSLLEGRDLIGKKILEVASRGTGRFGVVLDRAEVKDIMFPGELKNVFARVVEARKDGLAALERARGETAALRSLANTARMLEGNPELKYLRQLQTIESSSGNTFVMGLGEMVERCREVNSP